MTTTLDPSPTAPSVPTDLMQLDAIVAFLGESGRPVSRTTAWRWTARHRIRNWAAGGRAGLYSLSDFLEVHARELPPT